VQGNTYLILLASWTDQKHNYWHC